jgi:hypothetical protein
MKSHDPVHRQTWDLIPWLINETLDDAQREIVESHLCECADCREELAFQHSVHAGIAEDFSTADATAPAALSRLFERIDAEDGAIPSGIEFDPLEADVARPVALSTRGDRRLRLSHLLAAAVIVEALGLVGLGTMLAGQRDALSSVSNYATLSESVHAMPGASIRLVPSPTLNVGALQSLLGDAGLRIIDSNAGATIFALGFESSAAPPANDVPDARRRRVDEALRQLRANSGVLLAEPILSATPVSR